MARKNVEAIVPLLPMQQGFLWRSLAHDADACGLTLYCTLRGHIDLPSLKQAWQQVVNTHQALRSSVHWKDLSVPVQVVHKEVAASVIVIKPDATANDVIAQPVSQQGEPSHPLDLTVAPAHQLTLTAISSDACKVEWLLSHVLLDGWSCSLVINDWLRHYSALINDTPVQTLPSMPLSQYSQWARKQDTAAVFDFWNAAIPTHVPLATPLTYLAPSENTSADTSTDNPMRVIEHHIDTDTTRIIVAACKRAGLSINSLLQAAFALVLKPVEHCDELVIASTISGRQADVPEIDTLVGMLINVMPVYVKFNPEQSLRNWLLAHQARFFASLPYAHVNLPDFINTRNTTDHTANTHQERQLNCLLVVENQTIPTASEEITVSDYKSGIVSEMDLTLLVIPAESLALEIRYRQDLLCSTAIDSLLQRLAQLLAKLPELMDDTLAATKSYQATASLLPKFNAVHKVSESKDANDAIIASQTGIDSAQDTLQPRPLLETQLSELWMQVFGKPVDVTTPFFDLGGTSLQAIRLFALIEKHMGQSLPATTLFTAPTIKTLASYLLDSQSDAHKQRVVKINSQGTNTPLFVPFEQSDMLQYRHLCEALGSDQPIYGLQTSQSPLHDDAEIEALIDTITTLHPDGPYMLAGLSGSGLTSWTIAQRLTARGHNVAMLALLDTYGPDYPHLPPPLTLLSRITRRLFHEGALFARGQFKKRLGTGRWQGGIPPMRPDLKNKTIKTQADGSNFLQSEYQKRKARDHRRVIVFAATITKSRPFIERLAVIGSVWIARINIRSFNLRMELVVLIQGLVLAYCQRAGIDPLDGACGDSSAMPLSTSTSTSASTSASASASASANRVSQHGNTTSADDGQPQAPVVEADTEATDSGLSALQVFLSRYKKMYADLKPYQGKLVYIAASNRQAVCLEDSTFGWSKLIPADVDIHQTPGTHVSMLNPPNVQSMADILSREMAIATRQRRDQR